MNLLLVFSLLISYPILTVGQVSNASSVITLLKSYGYTNFSSLLESSGVLDSVQDLSTITIFPPTDAALRDPDSGFYEPAYNVLAGRYESFASLPNISFVPTLLNAASGIAEVVEIYPRDYSALSNLTFSLLGGGFFRYAVINASTPLSAEANGPVIWALSDSPEEGLLLPPVNITTSLNSAESISFLPANVNTTNLTAIETATPVLTFRNASFLNALQQTNLVDYVDQLTNITIFVPSDEAFDAVASGPGGINSLSTADLANIIRGHIVTSRIYATSFNNVNPFSVQAVNGDTLDFRFTPVKDSASGILYNKTYVNNAVLWGAGTLLPNGVVYFIDEVLYPGSTSEPIIASSTGIAVFPNASSGIADVASTSIAGTQASTTAAGGTSSATASVSSASTVATSGLSSNPTQTSIGVSTTSASTSLPTYTGAAGLGRTADVGAAAMFVLGAVFVGIA